MNEKIELSNGKKITGWVIASLLTTLYLFSAASKFMQPEQMNEMDLSDWRILIAIGEITSALLFLFPKTNIYGSLLLSTYMGGAIISHMSGGTSILFPSLVLIVVWVVAFIRNPELLKM